jgi:hypothetical protein
VSLVEVINVFKTATTYAVTRPSAGTLELGRFVPGDTTPLTVVAVVVPLSGRDLKVLPEGRRVEDSRKVITVTQLKAGDLVTIDAESWEVFHVDGPWIFAGNTHYNCFVSRQAIAAT